jgi:hypothetical protein
MFRESYWVHRPCEEARYALAQLRGRQLVVESCQQALERENALWEESCEAARACLAQLQALDYRWTRPSRYEQPGTRTAWPSEVAVPPVPREYPAYMEFFSKFREERARLLDALNAHLIAQCDFEGVAEMELLDTALDRLHQLSLARFEREPRLERLTVQLQEAGAKYGKANRRLYEALEKMPRAGAMALTRLAQILVTKEHGSPQAAFDWLLSPPEPLAPGLPVVALIDMTA